MLVFDLLRCGWCLYDSVFYGESEIRLVCAFSKRLLKKRHLAMSALVADHMRQSQQSGVKVSVGFVARLSTLILVWSCVLVTSIPRVPSLSDVLQPH